MTIYATTKGHQHKYVIYSQFKVNHLKSMKQLCAAENLVFVSKLAQLWFPRKNILPSILVNIGQYWSRQYWWSKCPAFCLKNEKLFVEQKGKETGLHLEYVGCSVFHRAGCVACCKGAVGKKSWI